MNSMPERVHIHETGYWETPYFARANGNGDDDEWICTGYQIRTYNGDVLFSSCEEVPCEQWLITRGYQHTENGLYVKERQ